MMMREGETRWFEAQHIIQGDRMAWLPNNVDGLPKRTVDKWREYVVPVTRTATGLVAQWPQGAVPWTREYAFAGMCRTDAEVAEKFPWCEPITIAGGKP